ncbi:MAG: hypothetical protein R6U55_10490 [Desulfovermiculus sp.]
MRKALRTCRNAGLLVFAAVTMIIFDGSSLFGQSGQDWRPVPLRGRITVDRRIDSNTSFNGVELIKREHASMTITVDDTVRVERAGAKRLYTQGAVTTSVNGREIWDFEGQPRFTHTYDLSGQEPFGPDPKLAKQRVYLEVNETKGRFHLKVPSGRAAGPCISTVKAGDQEKKQTKQIAMEFSAWFPDRPGEMEGSYQTGAGIIQGQYKMTGYQLPGGPVTGEEKPRIWAADDPDLPGIRRQVGDEKLIPVEYKVTWNLSFMDREPEAVPRIRTMAKDDRPESGRTPYTHRRTPDDRLKPGG